MHWIAYLGRNRPDLGRDEVRPSRFLSSETHCSKHVNGGHPCMHILSISKRRLIPSTEVAYGTLWWPVWYAREGYKCSEVFERAVMDEGELTGWFRISSGVKQGCVMSGFLFLLVLWIGRWGKQQSGEEKALGGTSHVTMRDIAGLCRWHCAVGKKDPVTAGWC